MEREVRGTAPLFPLTVEDVQARSQRYIDFLVPGLLALTIMQISVAGSGYNIVEYRRKGILKRLFVTPVRPSQFIGGLVIARLAITVVQVSFLLAVAVVLLDVPVVGNPLELLVLIFLGSSIFLSLGFWMGSLAKTQQAIMLLGNLITLPQMFLSGVFFSIESMPDALQPLAKLLPLTHVVDGVREGKLSSLQWADLLQSTTAQPLAFGFKYFQQLQGSVIVPNDFTPHRVWVQVKSDSGAVEMSFPWQSTLPQGA